VFLRLGYWLAVLLVISGVASCAGTYVSEMTSDSYMLAGMSDSKMVPSLFSRRLKNDTPANALLLRLLVILLAQPFNFKVLLHSHAILHALRMLLQCASFVFLRRNRPDLNRPFKVPFGLIGAYVVPGSLATVSLLQILFAHWSAWLGAIVLICLGVLLDRMASA
jgi:amino acid transporter